MNPAVRLLLPVVALLCSCQRTTTQVERECELLPVVLRHSYERDLPGFEGTSPKTIFVGRPSDDWADGPRGRPLIQMFYHDPSLAWLAAFASSGVSVLPASHAAFTHEHPWYHDPKTRQRVIVFAVHSITFRDLDHASVLTSACMAPLGGGEATYFLTRERGAWHVTRTEPGAVY